MPLLSEIARITGGRIFIKDASGVKVVPSNKGFFISNENHDVYNPETKKWVSAPSDKAEFYFSSRAEAERVAETVDSVLSDLVGLAKKAGEALMEPTEKAAAGDTKDGDDDKPFEAYGVKGMKSVQWRKSFKNQKEFEKWLEANEGDVEVQGYRDL